MDIKLVGFLLLVPLLLFGGQLSFAEGGVGQILQVTNQGVTPPVLKVQEDELSVFILNSTSSSLVTFEIEYGKRDIHCTNGGLKTTDHGTLRSAKPLAPRDFAATCFHDPGTYPVRVFGIPGRKEPVTVSVVLE